MFFLSSIQHIVSAEVCCLNVGKPRSKDGVNSMYVKGLQSSTELSYPLIISCVLILYSQLDHKLFEGQDYVIHFDMNSNAKYGIGGQ